MPVIFFPFRTKSMPPINTRTSTRSWASWRPRPTATSANWRRSCSWPPKLWARGAWMDPSRLDTVDRTSFYKAKVLHLKSKSNDDVQTMSRSLWEAARWLGLLLELIFFVFCFFWSFLCSEGANCCLKVEGFLAGDVRNVNFGFRIKGDVKSSWY